MSVEIVAAIIGFGGTIIGAIIGAFGGYQYCLKKNNIIRQKEVGGNNSKQVQIGAININGKK